MNYMGIDLGCSAVSKKVTSAVAVLDDSGHLIEKPQHFRKAKELHQIVSQYESQSVILAVDAPRSVPDYTEENYAYRSCERAIKAVDKEAGTFYGATALYMRWFEIERKYLQDIKIIETYPRVVWKILNLPGKPKDFSENRQVIWQRVGELVKCAYQDFSHHQIDAVLCAYTAFCYGKNQCDWFGEPGEGLIITPAINNPKPLPQEVEYIEQKFKSFLSMQQLRDK